MADIPEAVNIQWHPGFYGAAELVHHFIDTQTLSTRYLRHCRVGFKRRCHRIASFSRLELTKISGTLFTDIYATLY